MLLRFDQYKCTQVFESWLKEVMVHYVRTFKPFSDMNGISFVTVALKTSSCHKRDKFSHKISVGQFCRKHCCSKQFCPMGDGMAVDGLACMHFPTQANQINVITKCVP